MKKAFIVLLLSLFLFSCSDNPPSIPKEKELESKASKEISTGKIEEKQEKLTEKIILEKCENYNSSPSFYFFINDICYSLGFSLSGGANIFFLNSTKDFKMVEHYTGKIKSFDNLFSENNQIDYDNWYGKYDYKYTQSPKDFTIYNDIPKQFSKIFRKIGIKKLPENYLKLDFLGYENKAFQEIVKEEKEFIKDGIIGEIDYSKVENLNLENLYEEIKKELENF